MGLGVTKRQHREHAGCPCVLHWGCPFQLTSWDSGAAAMNSTASKWLYVTPGPYCLAWWWQLCDFKAMIHIPTAGECRASQWVQYDPWIHSMPLLWSVGLAEFNTPRNKIHLLLKNVMLAICCPDTAIIIFLDKGGVCLKKYNSCNFMIFTKLYNETNPTAILFHVALII